MSQAFSNLAGLAGRVSGTLSPSVPASFPWPSLTAASRTTRLLYILIVEDEGLEATADEGNEPSAFGHFFVHGEFTEGMLSDVPDERNAPAISCTFLSR